MKTYEDDRLSVRFAALASEPLEADWDDVLSRVRRALDAESYEPPSSRNRRLAVAVVAIMIVAAASTAAWAIVREVIVDQGFLGLPPVGASPSEPRTGELVASFQGRTRGIVRRTPAGYPSHPLTHVFLYADGRLVWHREWGAPAAASELSGFLEQRLTPEGVDLVRSQVLKTGLFDRGNLALVTERMRGLAQARRGDRVVVVDWEERPSRGTLDGPEHRGHAAATPEQERAIERLDELLTDPGRWLPARAWAVRPIRAYVASRYAVCWTHKPQRGPDDPPASMAPEDVFALLPPSVKNVVRRHGFERGPWDVPPEACSLVPTDDARAVAAALDDSAFERRSETGDLDGGDRLARLTYRMNAPGGRPGAVIVYFEPALPHGAWVCTPCG